MAHGLVRVRSDLDDFYAVRRGPEVLDVPGQQLRFMSERRGRNKKIQSTSSRVPPQTLLDSGQFAVALGSLLVERQRFEKFLNERISPQSPRSLGWVRHPEEPELELGQSDRTHGQLAGQRWQVRREDNTGVENRDHAPNRSQGSTIVRSKASRSESVRTTSGSSNSSLISS